MSQLYKCTSLEAEQVRDKNQWDDYQTEQQYPSMNCLCFQGTDLVLLSWE